MFSSVSSAIASFWSSQKTGANVFSNIPYLKRFQDAKKTGIQFLRITPSKWKSKKPGSSLGDFLIGDKDNYTGLIKKDLVYLVSVLDKAHKAKMKVVLTMLSLPGSRWSQHNCNAGKCTQERKLWQNYKYHQQSAHFWKDLAFALKDHPAIVAYNILNEPSPEKVKPKLRDWYTSNYQDWYKKVKDSPADLNLFYKTIIASIREVDKTTSILLDTGFYGTPYGITVIDPSVINDDNVIYSFHSYIPYRFITNQGQFLYPGMIPVGELDIPIDNDAQAPYAPEILWNSDTFVKFYQPVIEWTEKYKVSPHNIMVGEFGVYRQTKGAREYLSNSINFFNKQAWHWAFYAYREDDGHQAMDLELGTVATPDLYWECIKNYSCQEKQIYTENPLWKVISTNLLGI